MSVGEGLATDIERAVALLMDTEEGKQPPFDLELLTFIRRPELRTVAEAMLRLAPSFSRTTVLRKLLEADEALRRALAMHVAAQSFEDDSADERSPDGPDEAAARRANRRDA